MVDPFGITVEKKSHKGKSLWRVLSVKRIYPLPALEATTDFHLFPKSPVFVISSLAGLSLQRFVATGA
jgi:hypothetical protein